MIFIFIVIIFIDKEVSSLQKEDNFFSVQLTGSDKDIGISGKINRYFQYLVKIFLT